MRAAIYARVSTQHQSQAQTIEPQVSRLQAHVQQRGWTLDPDHHYLDEGYSGARLNRPGLDRLRDAVRLAEFEVVVIAAPDRLARKYVHQVLILEELQAHGCQIEFVDRPMSQDPNDQLLLQIRGAVAEYERSLITERMRRGRLAKLRAGQLLPRVRVPFGYRVDPDRPRDPAGLRFDAYEAVLVQELFNGYLEPGATLRGLALQLTARGIATPRGMTCWSPATVRGILKNRAYVGHAQANRTQQVPARRRKSALLPVGSGVTCSARPEMQWIPVTVPALITAEVFDQVQEKLAHNQRSARRHNTRHRYLLRTLVSCGLCKLSAAARTTWDGYGYYVCGGHHALRQGAQRCSSRFIRAPELDAVVWHDLSTLLTQPQLIATALERAHSGLWLPHELQARRNNVRQAIARVEGQQQRLLDAYLSGVLELAEFERKRHELAQQLTTLHRQQHQLEASAKQRLEVAAIAQAIETFCQQASAGLANATFDQKRALVELLIDRVVVTHEEVEIRYVVPTSPEGTHTPFCHLRTDYLLIVFPLVRHVRRRAKALGVAELLLR